MLSSEIELIERVGIAYHQGCGAYETYLNATISASGSSTSMAMSTTASSSSASASSTQASSHSGSSTNIGPLVGGIVGGVVGIVIILAAAFLIYRHMQNKHEASTERNTRMSIFSGSEPATRWDPTQGMTPPPGSPPPAFNPYYMPGLPVGSSGGDHQSDMVEKQSQSQSPVTLPNQITRKSVLSTTQSYDTTMLSHLDRQNRSPSSYSNYGNTAEPM